MLTPFLALVSFVVLFGVIEMVKESFGYIPFYDLNEVTLKYYKDVLLSEKFYTSLFYTFYLGIVPTILSVFFGVMFAILIYFNDKRYNSINKVLQIPIVIPYIVMSFFVIIMFSQTGIVSSVLTCCGLIDNPNDFPLLIFDEKGVGILIVYFLKQVPFVFFVVSLALRKINRNIVLVSRNLGASTMYTVFKIILPLIKNSIIVCIMLVFSFNFCSFEVPLMLGNPKYDTLPILSYNMVMDTNFSLRPSGMVINTLLFIISVVITVFVARRFENEN